MKAFSFLILLLATKVSGHPPMPSRGPTATWRVSWDISGGNVKGSMKTQTVIPHDFTSPMGLQSSRLSLSPNDYTDAYLTAKLTAATLSIIGCIFLITINIHLKNHKFTLEKMVIQLSLMDMMWALFAIVEIFPVQNEMTCKLYSIFESFGLYGAMACTCCFAHALYIIVKYAFVEIIDQYYRFYLIIGIVAGIIGSSVAGGVTYYVMNDEGRCSSSDNYWELFILTGIPAILAMLFCSICYGLVIKKLKEFTGTLDLALLCYPLILIICYLPDTLAIALEINLYLQPPLGWLIGVNFLFNSQGFLNGFAYGLSKRVRAEVKDKCCNKRDISVDQQVLLQPNYLSD